MKDLKLSIFIEAVDRITGPVRRITTALKGLGLNIPRITSFLRGMMSMAARATGALVGLAAVSFTGLGLGVLATGRTFERFRNQLEGLEGSSDGAQRSMNWIKDFAKRTPYELDQVMEAFIALRNYGIDPTQGALMSLGDLSAQMGKPLMQAIEMMADAQQGEFERLKEFGVRASVIGNQVAFTYVKAGKEITVNARKSATAISDALEGIFSDKAAGAMKRQSASFDGMFSNLKDMFNDFQQMIADAGVFDFLKGELANLLKVLDGFAKTGKLTQWAKEISASMISMFKSLKTAFAGVDWVAGIKGLFAFIEGAAKFIKAIGGITGIITGAGAVALGWLTTSLMSLGAVIAGIAGVAAAPIVATIAVIGLLAVAGWMVYRSWGDITKKSGELWNGFAGMISGALGAVKGAFSSGITAIWNIFPAWFRSVLTGAAFVVRMALPSGMGGGGVGAATGVAAGALALSRPRPAIGGRGAALDASGHIRVSVDDRRTTIRATTADPRMSITPAAGAYRGGNGD